ncbi:MAG: DUF433 domain-containing protein [Acidobacteriota bacterium]
MPAQVLTLDSIVSDPDVRGGSPVIADTGIRVSDLAAYHTVEGLDPGQLALQFGLDLTDVHAALAYYYRHKPEIDREIRDQAEQANALRQELAARTEVLPKTSPE